jgi:hypothetical protein
MSLDSCRTVIPGVDVRLVIQNHPISEPAPEFTKSVLARSEQARSIVEDESVPITLSNTLSDFFRIAGDLELGAARLAQRELNGFCP